MLSRLGPRRSHEQPREGDEFRRRLSTVHDGARWRGFHAHFRLRATLFVLRVAAVQSAKCKRCGFNLPTFSSREALTSEAHAIINKPIIAGLGFSEPIISTKCTQQVARERDRRDRDTMLMRVLTRLSGQTAHQISVVSDLDVLAQPVLVIHSSQALKRQHIGSI
ncbi:hypothetical protein NA56DRAFT_744486 [Hyaloscypha hepaticicola]|uniref:Uncharacterized protein n=1 Tax=Hyaloscypha hepaticicola TaxID=2082293 RepID=A0A2J6QJ65_9HELO|nr:hypothetical protein NA56DRAFT_744486 [Hyaloscypha hepaticicola]